MFFMYLDRLANAEKLKEIDRINARTALNDFITGLGSIVHHQNQKHVEELKRLLKEKRETGKSITRANIL